ncbi:MAG: hypoxanthine phosphoribosyltransferase [candidate division Zixibacteria bacterium]|nr:hypoxanthine phosphoribosyltransferase [candidate division Zixibacteria bacterium]
MHRRIAELATAVTGDFRDKNPVLLGTLKGSFIFLAQLVLQLDFDLDIDFISARSYDNLGTSTGKVDLFKNLSIDIKGRHLLVVEDIIDTGFTLRQMLQDFELVRPESVSVIALLNKKSQRKIEVPIKYVGFELEDQFVVGFGMDYAEKYRNLPYIAVLKH